MSFFHTILNYINKNKKSLIYIALFIFVFYISSEFSFAGDTPSTWDSSSSGDSWDDPNIFVQVVNWLVKISSALLWLLTFLVWLFLYPWWTSWSAIWLTDPLKTMWILVSNVVYFIFAFIFIWIAFMNIIWKEDNYQLKQAIPRFIVWVLIVPFSWFFVQFVISLSSILTVWILTLPYDTFKWTTFFSDTALQKVSFCDSYIVNMWGNSEWEFPIKCKEWHNDQVTLEKILNPQDSNSLFGIMAFYTYGVMKLDANGVLHREDVWSSLKSFFDMWLKAIFDILFIIVYLLLMIALALALFVRWIMLWVFWMFSPIFWLLFFFKKWWEWIWEWAAKKFNIQQFINLALVPVYVAWALAFWLVFIFIAWEWLWATSSSWDWEFSMSWNLVKFWWFEFMLSWAVSDSSLRTWSEVDKWIKGYDWTLWTLLLHLFGLWILWMAVMAALKSSEITWSAVEPIAQFGSSVWDLIKKSPTYMPIIPTPSGMMSQWWLARIWSEAKSYYDTRSAKTWTEFLERNNLFQSESSQANTKSNVLLTKLKSIEGNQIDKPIFEEFTSAIKEFRDVAAIRNSESWRNLLMEMARKLGVDESLRKTWTPQEIANLIRAIHNKWIEKWDVYDWWIFRSPWIVASVTPDSINAYLKWHSASNSWDTWAWWNSNPQPAPHSIHRWWDNNTINIYWNDATQSPINININNETVDQIAAKFSSNWFKWKYNQWTFETMLSSAWVTASKIAEIVNKLKEEDSEFFNT